MANGGKQAYAKEEKGRQLEKEGKCRVNALGVWVPEGKKFNG